jgi:hypothetical protein
MRDLSHTDGGIGQQRLGGLNVLIGQFRRAASRAANTPRGGKARLGALPDQTALEFRQRAEHVKDKPTLRGRRVEGFGQAAKADTSQSQFLDGFDQLLHRARQAVELPYDQGVSAAREFQGVAQGWSIRSRARHLLDENLPTSRLHGQLRRHGSTGKYRRKAC